MYIYIYIYIYVYTYTHTHIYIYTHTYVPGAPKILREGVRTKANIPNTVSESLWNRNCRVIRFTRAQPPPLDS